MKPRNLKGVATLALQSEKCIGCSRCEEVCPHGVFSLGERPARVSVVDGDACMECGACASNCPEGAISVRAGVGCATSVISGWLSGKGLGKDSDNESGCDCRSQKCC